MSESDALHPTYELTTIADLLAIPVNRLGNCLRDLEYAVQFAHLVFGEGASPDKLALPFRWTDDDNHTVCMGIGNGESITLDVTDEPQESEQP